MGETVYRCRLSYSWHALTGELLTAFATRDETHRYDDMRHIAIFRNDLQPLHCLRVAHNIVEQDRTVLLDPA